MHRSLFLDVSMVILTLNQRVWLVGNAGNMSCRASLALRLMLNELFDS